MFTTYYCWQRVPRDARLISYFLSRFDRSLRKLRYGPEMWSLFEKGQLQTDTVLTGHYVDPTKEVDTAAVLREIQIAAREEAQKRGLSKYQKKQQSSNSYQRKPNDPKPLTEDEVRRLDEIDAKKSYERSAKKAEQRRSRNSRHNNKKRGSSSHSHRNSNGGNRKFQHKKKFRK